MTSDREVLARGPFVRAGDHILPSAWTATVLNPTTSVVSLPSPENELSSRPSPSYRASTGVMPSSWVNPATTILPSAPSASALPRSKVSPPKSVVCRPLPENEPSGVPSAL